MSSRGGRGGGRRRGGLLTRLHNVLASAHVHWPRVVTAPFCGELAEAGEEFALAKPDRFIFLAEIPPLRGAHLPQYLEPTDILREACDGASLLCFAHGVGVRDCKHEVWNLDGRAYVLGLPCVELLDLPVDHADRLGRGFAQTLYYSLSLVKVLLAGCMTGLPAKDGLAASGLRELSRRLRLSLRLSHPRRAQRRFLDTPAARATCQSYDQKRSDETHSLKSTRQEEGHLLSTRAGGHSVNIAKEAS